MVSINPFRHSFEGIIFLTNKMITDFFSLASKSTTDAHHNWRRINSEPVDIDLSYFTFQVDPFLREFQEPEQFFSLIFDERCFQLIRDSTNRNYEAKIEKKSNLSLQDKALVPLTLQDIKSYFGIIIMMGILRLPEYKMHWNNNHLWESKLIKQTMATNRLKAIGTWLK